MAKVIKLVDKISPFAFTVDAKELDAAISKVSSAIAASQANAKSFILAASGKKVALIAYNPDTFVFLILKTGQATGEGSFGFVSTHVQGLIKGRGEMEFDFKGAECSFKVLKGNYSGKLVTLPITGDQVTLVNNSFELKESKNGQAEKSVLPRHVLDHLKEGVSITGIKDIYTGNALLAFMVLNEKGVLTVSAHDNHHFGHYKAKVKAGGITFRAALPSSHFLIIDKMVEGEEAKFYIRQQNMRVEGDNFVLILPAHQAEASAFDRITLFIKDLDEATFSCVYDHDKFSGVCENLFTLHAVNTSFDIAHKKGSDKLSVVFNTSNGSAQDSLKIKADVSASVSVRVDPRMVRDINGLLRGQGDVKFSIVQNKVIRLQCTTKSGGVVNLISALSE